MNANINRNKNNVDGIVVVHKIPKWLRGGMAPRVQLGIISGDCYELDRRFQAARLLAAPRKTPRPMASPSSLLMSRQSVRYTYTHIVVL
jgi:hypothetical protein